MRYVSHLTSRNKRCVVSALLGLALCACVSPTTAPRPTPPVSSEPIPAPSPTPAPKPVDANLVPSADPPSRTEPAQASVQPLAAEGTFCPEGQSVCGKEYKALVRALTQEERTAMTGVSYHEGCPVSLDELSVVEVDYWSPQGSKRGQLVVASTVAESVAKVFEVAYSTGYPIHSIKPIRVLGGDDDVSMAQNNTSGFNCRQSAASKAYSRHSYGTAIDLNPLVNPYVRSDGKKIQPIEGKEFADRTVSHPQLLTREHPVVQAFYANGFKWGGVWRRSKDYQHFSVSGR